MSDERIAMSVEVPGAKPPSKILAFDSTKKAEPIPVDLDQPFFRVKRTEYPACNHQNRGVTMDVATRKVFCLCGEHIDAFDALLIYAHAERHLQSTRHYIEEAKRKEAEKKAAKPFVREVNGFHQERSKRGRFLYYILKLECGHHKQWDRRKPPRRATCTDCISADKLKAKGVAVIAAQNASPAV